MKHGNTTKFIFFTVWMTLVVCLAVGASVVPDVCAQSASLAAFVPGKGVLTGATVVTGPAYYNPGTLWNYIDGGALPYLDYGVTDVVTYTLGFEGGAALTVDIYAMADSLGAFGIFTSESYPDYTYIDLGVEGYTTGESAVFWKDRYYVKIFPPASGAECLKLERTAHAIDSLIPDGGGIPRWFGRFPQENRNPRSETYTAKNVLGQDFLERAFSVTYTSGDTEYQIYLITAPDNATAADWLDRYRSFIGEYGTLYDEKPSFGDDGFIGDEEWYGLMMFVRSGNCIVGTVGLADRNLAVRYLAGLIDEKSENRR